MLNWEYKFCLLCSTLSRTPAAKFLSKLHISLVASILFQTVRSKYVHHKISSIHSMPTALLLSRNGVLKDWPRLREQLKDKKSWPWLLKGLALTLALTPWFLVTYTDVLCTTSFWYFRIWHNAIQVVFLLLYPMEH